MSRLLRLRVVVAVVRLLLTYWTITHGRSLDAGWAVFLNEVTPCVKNENKPIMEECAKITIGQHGKKITAGQLKRINDTRIFLWVITITNLANLDGTQIDFEQIDKKWRAPSNLLWPQQCALTKDQWNTFQWALRKTFYVKGRGSTRGSLFPLRTPLGDWLQRPRHVQYNANRNGLSIYHYENNEGYTNLTIKEYEM